VLVAAERDCKRYFDASGFILSWCDNQEDALIVARQRPVSAISVGDLALDDARTKGALADIDCRLDLTGKAVCVSGLQQSHLQSAFRSQRSRVSSTNAQYVGRVAPKRREATPETPGLMAKRAPSPGCAARCSALSVNRADVT
jgi:hypothetical protein